LPEDAIEECRKLCGGHGYLNSSGLPELFAVYVPACTYKGDILVEYVWHGILYSIEAVFAFASTTFWLMVY